MPRPGIEVPRGQLSYEADPGAVRTRPRKLAPNRAAGAAGIPGRRTVTITGQGAEGYASRNGTRPSMAARHRHIKRHERPGFRPDRVAMWAVLLGVMLMIAAATSSHAAGLAVHHAGLAVHHVGLAVHHVGLAVHHTAIAVRR